MDIRNRDRVVREREQKWFNMAKKQIEIKPNSKLNGKVIGCSEIFTLDDKGNILKKEWKCEEEKNWKW